MVNFTPHRIQLYYIISCHTGNALWNRIIPNHQFNIANQPLLEAIILFIRISQWKTLLYPWLSVSKGKIIRYSTHQTWFSLSLHSRESQSFPIPFWNYAYNSAHLFFIVPPITFNTLIQLRFPSISIIDRCIRHCASNSRNGTGNTDVTDYLQMYTLPAIGWKSLSLLPAKLCIVHDS